MYKTDWVELKRLKSEKETWYKRRVYKSEESEIICCTTCSRNKESFGKAMMEYSVLDEKEWQNPEREFAGDAKSLHSNIEWAESGWDGGTYCHRKCMPKDKLRRYNRANRRYKNPEYGKKKELMMRRSSERLDRLVSRYEALGCIRGSVTVLSVEEGISRQRIHKLLEGWYGQGQVPCLTAAEVAAKSA